MNKAKAECSFHTWFLLFSYHFPHGNCFQRLLFEIINVIAMHSFPVASVHLAAMVQHWQIGKKNFGMQLHLFSIPETIGERAICWADAVLLEQQLFWLCLRPHIAYTSYSHTLMFLPCFGRLFFHFYLSISVNLILMQLTWYSTLSKGHLYNEISV